MSKPLLGYVEPHLRTNEQNDAHAASLAKMKAFTLKYTTPPVGTKVLLTNAWNHPTVVQQLGFPFTGFRQLTGSCVGASGGTWVTTVALTQAVLNQTTPFIAFWPFFYGRTRYNEGDRGQGEGAVDSVLGETVAKEGYFDIKQDGLPAFDTGDGFALTSRLEMQWSDGGSSTVTKWLPLGQQHVGAKAALNSPDDIAAAIMNGYAVVDGDAMYVGHGSIKGSGDNAYVSGRYDGNGGHSTCFLGYWNHPNDGELFLYSNNWDGSTYPKDPAGAGRCCVWITRSEVDRHFRSGGGDNGETIALSHVDWFEPQDVSILTWLA
jgi:hypothetical protein